MNAENPPVPGTCAPKRPIELFLVFNGLALRGFGGVLPWAQRALVDEVRWLTVDEYVAMLSLAQALPGPNVCNLALMVGERFFGVRGAIAALSGMLAAPAGIVVLVAVVHARVAEHPVVINALAGMGAVSAGLIIGMALRLLPTQRRNRTGWILGAAAFVMVGLLRWPLVWVMPALGALSVLHARRRDAP